MQHCKLSVCLTVGTFRRIDELIKGPEGDLEGNRFRQDCLALCESRIRDDRQDAGAIFHTPFLIMVLRPKQTDLSCHGQLRADRTAQNPGKTWHSTRMYEGTAS